MVDAREDAGFVASERARVQEEWKRKAQEAPAEGEIVRKRGTLAALPSAPPKVFDAPSDGTLEVSSETEGEAHVEIPVKPSGEAESSPRLMRLGIAGGIVLLLFVVWVMQRRAR